MTTVPAGNRARFAAKPLTHSGTPVPLWLAAFQEAPLPALDLAGCPGLVVVAAHPDDETFGVGAMITQLVAMGVRVQVVCVSDGGRGQAPRHRSGFAPRPFADSNYGRRQTH